MTKIDRANIVAGILLCLALIAILGYGWYRGDREADAHFRGPEYQTKVLANAQQGDAVVLADGSVRFVVVVRQTDDGRAILFFAQRFLIDEDDAAPADALARSGSRLVQKGTKEYEKLECKWLIVPPRRCR